MTNLPVKYFYEILKKKTKKLRHIYLHEDVKLYNIPSILLDCIKIYIYMYFPLIFNTWNAR